MPPTKQVLTFSSHVVHGYVGNKAMTFPLQLRGWDVDAINTTNFSNHPGYGQFKGPKVEPEVITEIHTGLENIDCEYDIILTGYVASAQTLQAVVQICSVRLKRNPECIWILDPVLGDNGRLYVSEDIIPHYKDLFKTNLVTLVTPNQFEMEVLTGVKINCLDSLKESIQKFHQIYDVKNIVVSSVCIKGIDNLICAGSTKGNSASWCYFEIPQLDAIFSGSGDLFLAILADSFSKHRSMGSDLEQGLDCLLLALSETISVVEDVLQLSYDIEIAKTKMDQKFRDKLYIPDLKIVQSRDTFLKPNLRKYKATLLPF
ncbi:unnamed protein product [Kuraishia capsulata CBS 1993]|uniref:pyridoxal kinase n=1 Tax=Kuraishia capsulata CBS 1993 TaxID=1382522 RepID=W6MWJ8_9ASCO|nr:uncharacterized protein KUCA_T00003513001 [Kuraishia capsulata CBS 1993]CDK27535.1 unnamed protein product [Kuraishia capsulata CBS 1993]